MVKLVGLDNGLHANLRVVATPSAQFGDNVGMVSVITREYARLLAHYPIFFRKNGETGQFEPGVLLGFANDENLFLTRDGWDAGYVPIQVQRQPFSVIQEIQIHDGVEAPMLSIAIDVDSPRLSSVAGERLFDADGEATPYLQKVTSAVKELVDGSRITFDFAARMADLDLVEPIRIDVEFVDGGEVKFQGLYAISAERLSALPAAIFMELRDAGYLEWAYFQIASMSQIATLIARKNRRLSGMAS